MRTIILGVMLIVATHVSAGTTDGGSDRLTVKQALVCAVTIGGFVYFGLNRHPEGPSKNAGWPVAPPTCPDCKAAENTKASLIVFDSPESYSIQARRLAHEWAHSMPLENSRGFDAEDPYHTKTTKVAQVQSLLTFYSGVLPEAATLVKESPRDDWDFMDWAKTNANRDALSKALAAILEYESPFLPGRVRGNHIQTVFTYATAKARKRELPELGARVLEHLDQHPEAIDAVFTFIQTLPSIKEQSYPVYVATKDSVFQVARLRTGDYPFAYQVELNPGAILGKNRVMEADGRYYAHSIFVPAFPPFSKDREAFRAQIQFPLTGAPGSVLISSEEANEIALSRLKLGHLLGEILQRHQQAEPELSDAAVISKVLRIEVSPR